jgi:hypothetical protein
MTVSGPPNSINPAGNATRCFGGHSPVGPVGRVRLVIGFLLVLSAGACTPTLATAPFPASADTTEPGTLLGPFEGRVTDGQANRPIPGALVWVSWRFCEGHNVCIPAGTDTFTGETDADGRYLVPRLTRFPGAVRLDGVTLVVYKRGYVAYRSDRLRDESAPGGAISRNDFAQTRNQVKLERFPDGGSHAEHLAFVGGSGALRAALRAEALQAGLDAASGSSTAVPLDATALLSVEELRQITGSLDELMVDRLEDRPRTPRYDSAHFRAQGRGEEFDAAFRISLFDLPADAEKDFTAQLADLPNAQALEPTPQGLGTRAARGRDGDADSGIAGLLIVDRGQRATVLVTCGVGLCRNTDAIDAIARKLLSRLPHVAHPPPQPRPVEKAPDKPSEKPPEKQEGLKLREPGLHR